MSIIGLDFGSHQCSFALWHNEKDTVEVLADDLGSRTTPSCVAFRGDEIITGSSATNQKHKNSSNTFSDIRSMLKDTDLENVYIPNLDKEVSTEELCSHYFRNVHNQVKQQAGKPVRECVIAVPSDILADNSNAEISRKRLHDSAQAGGIRIKSMVSDSAATLMAYGFDNANLAPSKVMVIDLGWNSTQTTIFNVNGGLFFEKFSNETKNVSGKVFVNCLAEHCGKDFMRKFKFPCTDNKKAMIILQRECELAIKALSTGSEAQFDIDSLCEGMDYQSKISRARFEDLCSIPFIHLKKIISDTLTSASFSADDITHVCLGGGFTAVPRVQSSIKTIFTKSAFSKARFEYSEALCIGAAIHGKNLSNLGLLENAPISSPVANCLTRSISLKSTADSNSFVVFDALTVLPCKREMKTNMSSDSGFLQILSNSDVLGEVVFTLENVADKNVTIALDVSLEGVVSINVLQLNEENNTVLVSLSMPQK
jgi:L1 cell adhesion molecule like protein